jgi:hypothetical protein
MKNATFWDVTPCGFYKNQSNISEDGILNGRNVPGRSVEYLTMAEKPNVDNVTSPGYWVPRKMFPGGQAVKSCI